MNGFLIFPDIQRVQEFMHLPYVKRFFESFTVSEVKPVIVYNNLPWGEDQQLRSVVEGCGGQVRESRSFSRLD